MAELPPPKYISLPADGIELELHGYLNEGKPRVLMLHGASASHETFLYPSDTKGLTGYLWNEGFEPWLLDWCGSNRVLDRHQGPGKWKPKRFDFDQAAEIDLRRALEKINGLDGSGTASRPVTCLLGFCMGSAVIAQAIAAGHLKHFDINNIVLMSIGLFYRSTAEGKLKVQDHVLERLLGEQGADNRFIDPRCHKGTSVLRNPWPQSFENLYSLWPGNFQPHRSHEADELQDKRHIFEQCNRVTFMFGQPYVEEQLVPELHRDPGELPKQFGAIALRMYVQAARNARRGWAADYDAQPGKQALRLLESEARSHFDEVERITLITGNNNRIWHRDSMDSMYEWLLRGPAQERDRVEKLVLHHYGHQDLLWGSNSRKDVYPYIAKRLSQKHGPGAPDRSNLALG